MTLLEFLQKTARILNELKIEYFVTGGVAVGIWARPRHTADIDIIIKITSSKNAKELIQKLKLTFKNSYLDYAPGKTEFNLIEPEFGFKIDFWIKINEFNLSCFKNSRKKRVGKTWVKFTSPEDLIISKLKWYQESESVRHLEDIKDILNFNKNLNQKYLNFWIKKLELKAARERVSNLPQ